MALVRRELLQITTPPRKAALEGFTPCPGDDAFYVGARDAPHVFPHDALCGAHASPVSPPPPPRSLVLQLASPPQFRRVSRPRTFASFEASYCPLSSSSPPSTSPAQCQSASEC